MFDSNEIAKQAKLRAAEIKADKNRRRKRWETAGIIFGICAMVSVVVIVIFPITNLPDNEYIFLNDEQTPIAAVPFPQIDENAKLYTGDEKEIIIPYIDNATISADTSEAIMVLFNPETNIYGFTFEISLKDTGETLYKSDLVEPGMCIENPKLSRTLTKGKYDAVLQIQFYELDNLILKNSAEVYFILLAE